MDWAPGVPVREAFAKRYQRLYGQLPEGRDIELESVRVVVGSATSADEPRGASPPGFDAVPTRRHEAWFGGRRTEIPLFDRDRLEPGAMLVGPALVFERVEPRGYKHFAVLRGVKADRVYLADPSRGNVRMPAYRFLDSWLGETGTGIIFVIEPKDGRPEGEFPLSLPAGGLPQPEIMTAREMLAVGNPFLRLPELSR